MKLITILFTLNVIAIQLLANPRYTKVISPNRIIVQPTVCNAHRTCAIIPVENNYLGSIEAGPRMDIANMTKFHTERRSDFFPGYFHLYKTEEKNLFYTTPMSLNYQILGFLITNPFKDRVLTVTITMQTKLNQGEVFVVKAVLDPMTNMTLPIDGGYIAPYQLFVRTNLPVDLQKILFLKQQ